MPIDGAIIAATPFNVISHLRRVQTGQYVYWRVCLRVCRPKIHDASEFDEMQDGTSLDCETGRGQKLSDRYCDAGIMLSEFTGVGNLPVSSVVMVSLHDAKGKKMQFLEGQGCSAFHLGCVAVIDLTLESSPTLQDIRIQFKNLNNNNNYDSLKTF